MIRAFVLLMVVTNHAPLIRQIAESGRVLEIAVPSHERLSPGARIAPGTPPLIAFRALEGKQRHRFGDLDLVLDDAGH